MKPKLRSFLLLASLALGANIYGRDLATLLPKEKELPDGIELETLEPLNHPDWMRTNPQVFRTPTELEPILTFLRTPALRADKLKQVLWAYYRMVNDLSVVLFEFKDAKTVQAAQAALVESMGKATPYKVSSHGTTLALIVGTDLKVSTQLADLVFKRLHSPPTNK